jgi:putative transposase
VKISMANVVEPEENGYAERLMRTIKEEEVDLSEYEDFSNAMNGLGRSWTTSTIATGSIRPWAT